MIRFAALSACETASASSSVIPSFKMTAIAVLLWLPLASAGVLAQSSSPSGSGHGIELLSVQNLSVPEQEMADYRPLVRSALLFSSFDGPTLDLIMDEQATAECILSSSGRAVKVVSGDNHFRYDVIPEQEKVSVWRLDSKGTALYELLVMNSNIAYDASGQLVNVQLPESLDHSQGAHLGATLEALLKVLADDDATQLLRRLSGQGLALLNVSAEQASLTIYSDSDPVRELFRAEIDKDHHQIVVLDADWLQQSELNSKSRYRGGALKLAAVLEVYKGSLSSVAMNYLRHVVDSVDKEKLQARLGQLGRAGEVGLNTTPAVSEPSTWQVDFYRLPVSPIYQLSGASDHRQIVRAVYGIMRRMASLDVQNARVAIDDHLYQELFRTYGSELKELFDSGVLLRAGSLPRGARPYQIHYGSSDWFIHYLGAHSRAVLGGMFIGGAVQAGFDIYKEYRYSGRLPSGFTEQEKRVLKEHITAGALRGGISSAVSFNLTSGLGLPSVIAGAMVGAGNSLYDSYMQGNLAEENANNMLLRAGAVSAVASAGSVIGAGIGSTVPLPFSQTAGALAGSLMGHYIYGYVEDNYNAIKSTIKDSFERSYQVDPEFWM